MMDATPGGRCSIKMHIHQWIGSENKKGRAFVRHSLQFIRNTTMPWALNHLSLSAVDIRKKESMRGLLQMEQKIPLRLPQSIDKRLWEQECNTNTSKISKNCVVLLVRLKKLQLSWVGCSHAPLLYQLVQYNNTMSAESFFPCRLKTTEKKEPMRIIFPHMLLYSTNWWSAADKLNSSLFGQFGIQMWSV